MFSSDLSKRRSGSLFPGAHRYVSRKLDAVVLDVLRQTFRESIQGRLSIRLPSGLSETFGSADAKGGVQVELNNYRIVWQCLRRGLLGFAECFMAGDVECDDLSGLFEFYFRNEKAIDGIGPGIFKTSAFDRIFHALRFNSRSGSRRNISAHYDLGNEFYSQWLGESWFYSSGIYEGEDCSLEDSQARKCQHIIDALKLDGTQSLLEIGCGWGGFAVAAAPHVDSIRAITISREQLAHTVQALKARKLDGKVDARFEDYRDTAEQFDRLVSIEMIEAVGEQNWPVYFKTLHERLRPGGVGVLQAITIAPAYYETYRRTPDFIQRYIFPGGMLPTVDKMREHAKASGLAFEEVETFGLSYARTLADWRQRFIEAWPRIEALGFDERFKRMWLYYLMYCETGFRQGSINVGLYRVGKRS